MGEYDQHFRDVQDSLGTIGSRLVRQHSAISDTTAEIQATHRALQRQIGEVADQQTALGKQLDGLGKDLEAFAERHRQDLQRLTAQVGLVDLRAEIARRYGAYEDVRRNVQGILAVMDSGLAHDATMQFIAETKAIDAPRYWLASMLNATVSWIRKDQVLMEKALAHAMPRDRSRTSLFAGLLNARYHRFEATGAWFRQYLRARDPLRLTDEFVVVLDAALLGVLGPETGEQVRSRCLTWYDQLSSRPELVAAQVGRWKADLARRAPQGTDAEDEFRRKFPALVEVHAQWQTTARDLRRTKSFAALAETLQPAGGAPAAVPVAGRIERIDRILLSLSRLPESGEREMRLQEFDLLRLSDPGLTEQALAEARREEATLDEPETDFLSLITNLAMHPERFDVSARTKQFATHLVQTWVADAVATMRERSASEMPESMTISIDNWSGVLGPDLPEPGEDGDDLVDELGRQMDQNTEFDTARERRTPQRFGFLAFAGAAALLWLTSWLGADVPFGAFRSLVLLGLCLGFLVVAGGVHLDMPQRLRAARIRGEQRKSGATSALRAAQTAHTELIRQWKQGLREADELRERILAATLPELADDPPESDDQALVARGQALLPAWDLKPAGW